MTAPQGGFAIGFESRPWRSDPDQSASRRQRLTARGPYQAAVPARIADLPVRVSAEVQAEAEDAVREITRFDAEVGALAARRAEVEGEDAATELAPLAAVLLRTESASSSEIEGVTAGARALALAAIEAKAGPNAQLVTANVVAMRRAVELADQISVESILAAHDALLAGHEYAAPGRLRTTQVWIGSNAISPHTASFVPPHHARVEDAMRDLIAFVARVDLPVLVHCAIAHAQFETIHPFIDGNGRTGRALIHTVLRRADALRNTLIPISTVFAGNPDRYIAGLTDYRSDPPRLDDWIIGFAEAAEIAAKGAVQLAADIAALDERIYRHFIEVRSQQGKTPAVPRRDAVVLRILEHLASSPVLTAESVVTDFGGSPAAAYRALTELAEAGILDRTKDRKGSVICWTADRHLALVALTERSNRVGGDDTRNRSPRLGPPTPDPAHVDVLRPDERGLGI